MSKRKNEETNKKGTGEEEERATKQARTEEAEDAASSAAAESAANEANTIAAAAAESRAAATSSLISHAQLASRRSFYTLELMDAMTSTNGSLLDRMQTVCKLLQEGANNPNQLLLNMSMREDDSKPTSAPCLFLLFRFLPQFWSIGSDDAATDAQKDRSRKLFDNTLKPLWPTLLLTFDPAATDKSTGNNALHELLRVVMPTGSGGTTDIIKQLTQHGVSVHARNLQGRTPLSVCATGAGGSSSQSNAHFIHLLRQLGADINAQDNDGNSMLHDLVRKKAINVLEDLFKKGGVDELDYTLRNNQGQTAADFAAVLHAQNDTEKTHKIHRLIWHQSKMWSNDIRPVILHLLNEPLIPDLARLTMEYIDGSGAPFVAAEVEAGS